MNFLLQPLAPLPLSLLDLALESLAVIAVAFTFIDLYKTWPAIPAHTAVHFGFTGKPDRWGSRKNYLVLPAAALLIYLIQTAIVYAVAGRFQSPWPPVTPDQQAAGMVQLLKVEVVWILALLQHRALQVALARRENIGRWGIPITLLVLMGTIFLYIALTNLPLR